MSTVQSCYCYAIHLEDTQNYLKILELHQPEKSEKSLQLLTFSLFSEYMIKYAFRLPKP